MLHCHHHTLSPQFFPLSLHHHSPSFTRTCFYKPTSLFSFSALPRPRPDLWFAQLPDPATTTAPITPPEEGGPIELPLSSPSIFATTDDPSPLQVATSVLLTGAIAVFLFRSIRRRAKRAKELRFRSSGAKKTMKEEALDSLKAMGSASIDAKKPPSPVQAFLGGISAAVIALILYKFTTTIEIALSRQTMSDNFSLAINSFMEDSTSEEIESKGNEQSGALNSTTESPAGSAELNSSQRDQNPDNSQ
ncbi:uncharacterized protein LOC110662787 isoform X2 [Hevea brasiliensis]|uniref:uncharacterized protein LOC110662787 isoform X2 n=1 Tax=Hevea brasiliensis TaxID=3981 RepID=UPI0025D1924A|nr:uncharacterized protein LOC110662787 isoform X2 [Hevea brasiliensis]